MALKLVTAPATTPVSVNEVKLHSRVSTSADDTLITALISAATEFTEVRTRRRLINSTWDYTIDSFCGDAIEVPYSPLSSVSSISYVDTDGNSQTLDSSAYIVNTFDTPGRVELAYGQSWPATRYQSNAITIRHVAGYGASSANVPAGIRQALFLLIGHWYEHREAAAMNSVPAKVELAFDALVAQYSLRPLGVA